MDADLVVVGGGHAGCEAALAASRLGCDVVLATLSASTIGALSCNPAIGGVGKGQLVRELDALGGAMARITDETSIQYRMLNTSKGEAVHSLRAQVDKEDYPRAMQRTIEQQERLRVVEGAVEDLVVESGRVVGVVLGDGSVLRCRAVILTNGTFLRGLMHTGEQQVSGGRVGEGAIGGLSAALGRLGFESGRLKTGTPPRLAAESIDWDRLDLQDGDDEPEGFSHFSEPPRRDWVACYTTRTNERAHDAIRENLHRSPMYSGEIEGVGPRYCPSIEDKVVRFPERTGHTIHLEPESRSTNSIYVNGISTSLPADVQDLVVRSIPGLENAKFLRHGYAVEYDFFPPHQIEPTFHSRVVENLYLAGQICGTSGYEEAAVQGFLAGVNAAHRLQEQEPFILLRDEAYMGVLADDLVRCDPREPYRMFTARAEYRLRLRHDNADFRLMERGLELGLVDEGAVDRMRRDRTRTEETLEFLGERFHDGRPLLQILKQPGTRYSDLESLDASLGEDWPVSDRVRTQASIEARYAHYIARQQKQIDKLRRLEEWQLPVDFDYGAVTGLRNEAREKLQRFRPSTLGQANRIAGVTPADLSCVMVALRIDRAELAPPTGSEGAS